jgi:integrase
VIRTGAAQGESVDVSGTRSPDRACRRRNGPSDPHGRLYRSKGVRVVRGTLLGYRFRQGVIVLARRLQDGVDLPLKTERSRRRAPLPANLLREFREDPRSFAGGLVFTWPEGEAINLSNFHRRVWRPLFKVAGIQTQTADGKVTFHSLRHSAATAARPASCRPIS